MQLHIVGKNITVTEALKTFIQDKFHPLEKLCQSVSPPNIVLHVEHLTHIAEATMHYHRAEIHASAQAEDMHAAIDALIDKLHTQIIKQKEKLIDSHR